MSTFGRFTQAGRAALVASATVVAALAPHPARAAFSYKLVGDASTITWDGESGGDWNTAANWNPATVPVAGYYAKFAVPSATSLTTVTQKHDKRDGFEATGILIDEGSEQVTLGSSVTWYSSFLHLRKNDTDKPAIINLSAHHLILNVPVTFTTLGSGDAGVLPGAEYNRSLNGTVGDANAFHFYAGDAEAADEAVNTSVIRGAATFRAVSIDANHIVQVTGSSASLTAAVVTVQAGGSLVLDDKTTVTATSLTGGVTVNGTVTIKHGADTLTLGGAWTFADGAAVVLEGTGEVVYADGADIDRGRVLTDSPYVSFARTGAPNYDDANYRMNNAANWSGDIADANGLIDARSAATTVRTGAGTSEAWAPGMASLTFIGSASDKEARGMQKCPMVTIPKIVFKAYSAYQLGGTGSNSSGKDHAIAADIVIDGGVDSDSADAVKFYAEDSRVLKHTGKLLGDGALKVTRRTATVALYEFYNDSPDFTGTLQANGATTTVRFNSAEGVGGNPGGRGRQSRNAEAEGTRTRLRRDGGVQQRGGNRRG